MFVTGTVLDLNPNNAIVLPTEGKIPKEYIADIPPQKKTRTKPTDQTKTKQKPLNLTWQSLYILDKRCRKQMLLLTSSQDLLITLQFVNQLTYGTALGKHTILILHLQGRFPNRTIDKI